MRNGVAKEKPKNLMKEKGKYIQSEIVENTKISISFGIGGNFFIAYQFLWLTYKGRLRGQFT